MVLLEAWKSMESEHGTPETLQSIESKMPRVVKKRRKVDGGVWEEYFDYIFPDDEMDKPNFKLLAMAHEWKLKMAAQKEFEGNNGDVGDDVGDVEVVELVGDAEVVESDSEEENENDIALEMDEE